MDCVTEPDREGAGSLRCDPIDRAFLVTGDVDATLFVFPDSADRCTGAQEQLAMPSAIAVVRWPAGLYWIMPLKGPDVAAAEVGEEETATQVGQLAAAIDSAAHDGATARMIVFGRSAVRVQLQQRRVGQHCRKSVGSAAVFRPNLRIGASPNRPNPRL